MPSDLRCCAMSNWCRRALLVLPARAAGKNARSTTPTQIDPLDVLIVGTRSSWGNGRVVPVAAAAGERTLLMQPDDAVNPRDRYFVSSVDSFSLFAAGACDDATRR